MLPDRVSNPGPLTYESGALPIVLRGPAGLRERLYPPEGMRRWVWKCTFRIYMYSQLASSQNQGTRTSTSIYF